MNEPAGMFPNASGTDAILALCSKFALALPDRLATIRNQFDLIDLANWQVDEVQALHRLVHSLIGAAGTFGMNSVTVAARALELPITAVLQSAQMPGAQAWAIVGLRLNKLCEVVQQQLSAIADSEGGRVMEPMLRLPHGNPLIHLIEDDLLQSRVLHLALTEKGFRVQTFNSLDGLRSAWGGSDERPAAVVMDMIFPEGDAAGANMIVELGLGQIVGVPVVFVSSRDDLAARLAAFRAGASRYLTKPIDSDRLCRLLDELTGRLPPEPYRVLLVDDEEALLEAYSLILRQAGMKVYGVTQALGALEALKVFQPDVVILDMYMPDASGPELAAVLREQDIYAQTPILFLSAEADPDRQLMALNLGGDDFLLKPIQPAHLVAAVTARARRIRQNEEVTRRLQVELYEREREHMALDRHALVSIADRAGNITYANDNFCEVSGYSRKELLGQNHRVLKSGVHDAAFYQELWTTVKSGKIWRGEICNRRKDGSTYWVSNTITPFLDQAGKIYQYVSIRTDITQFKRAAVELERMGQRLILATQAAGIGIFDYDVVGNNLSWDAHMFALYGQDPGNFSGAFDAWANALHPDDAQRCHREFRQALSGERTFDTQFRVIWPDGSMHWLQAMAAVSHGPDGQPRRMIGTNWDVSKSKEIEKQLRDAKSQAEAANRAKSDFVSSMSHELRTPMNAILGFGQMLEVDTRLDDEQRDNVNEILKAGHHLLSLINQVLDLAKVEAGQLNLSIESVGLAQLIGDCIQLTHPLAQARKISIALDVPPLSAVQADRFRLKQVLLNLLSNAIKYSHEHGSIDLQVQPGDGDGDGDGDGSGRGRRLRISVRDRGIGIAPDKIGQLFQPFNRLNAEDSEIEGTGIGLTITRQLVELMGGEIGVQPNADIGTTFWLELPEQALTISPDELSDGDQPVASVAPLERESRVLCIDDNPSNLKLITQMLGSRKQIALMMAQVPELGLEWALTRQPDLILLDINMPGLNGYQVLNQIRADERTKHIPVIAISANAMPSEIERGRAAGFAAYLAKPLNRVIFLQTVDHYL